MRPTNADYEILQAMLAAELGAELDGEPFDPGVKGPEKPKKKWRPYHGPTQTKIFQDQADIVGACAEKGTGKSIVLADKVIAHCFSEWDALAVIIGNSHRALAEGICHDLVTFSLPRWKDGNREPLFNEDASGKLVPNPRAGELMDEGVGLEYTAWKCDPNNKDLYLKIRNKFGGWSRIRVIAVPYGDMVQSRVTNLNASLFYLEEATRCDSNAYYVYPSMQLGRRRGIKGPQQFLFSCNPDDPLHWVYVWMYREVVVTADQPGKVWPDDPEKPGIRRDIDVAFYYLPFEENRRNIPTKYRESLAKTLRANPILAARLIRGKWIAMPAGDALFKAEFSENRHVKGDEEKKRGLTPVPGYPIVLGMDWGSRNFGLVFQQIIETEDGPLSLPFSEVTFYQEMHKTERVARAILELMRFWNEWLRAERGWSDEKARRDAQGRVTDMPSWCWWFITGDDATTNYNPESGNIHARDLEDHMRKVIEADPHRYRGITPPRIRGCPRPKDSVGKRVDIVAEHLMEDRIAISALCHGLKGMFMHLPRDKDNPSAPAKGNRWIHILDGFSYPLYYRRFVLPAGFYNYNEGAAISVA